MIDRRIQTIYNKSMNESPLRNENISKLPKEQPKEKIVFWGTSAVCIPYLKNLQGHFDVRLIITQPDSLGGRGRQKIVPPVKNFALKENIDILQPENLKEKKLVEQVEKINPVIGVVISYGKIIPKALFTIPKFNTVNVHYSLLPLYRGAAPVQRALEKGDKKTGITIFELKRKMDSGDIWARKEFDIVDSDTTAALWERLSEEGGPFLVDTIKAILSGRIKKIPQEHEKATYAGPVKKEESQVDWRLPAGEIVNKLRAFTPWPGLCCSANDRLFKLSKLRVCAQAPEIASLQAGKKPGHVLSMDKESLKVCCGNNTVIEILEIQPPGKKPMTPYNYCLGNDLPESLC